MPTTTTLTLRVGDIVALKAIRSRGILVRSESDPRWRASVDEVEAKNPYIVTLVSAGGDSVTLQELFGEEFAVIASNWHFTILDSPSRSLYLPCVLPPPLVVP